MSDSAYCTTIQGVGQWLLNLHDKDAHTGTWALEKLGLCVVTNDILSLPSLSPEEAVAT
jgi:hypothetical protein